MNYFYLAILWTLYFILHSFLAGNGVKSFIKNKLPSIFPFYRIIYNLIALGTLFVVLNYQNNITSNTLFDETIITKYVGYGITIIGLFLGILAFKNYSGLEFSGLDFNRKQVAQNNTLTTTGFNKYVRHPLYFSALLIVWGYFLINPTSSVIIMNSVITAYLIIGTKLEEQKLVETFGETYKQYIKEVPMLLPTSIFKIKKKS